MKWVEIYDVILFVCLENIYLICKEKLFIVVFFKRFDF